VQGRIDWVAGSQPKPAGIEAIGRVVVHCGRDGRSEYPADASQSVQTV